MDIRLFLCQGTIPAAELYGSPVKLIVTVLFSGLWLYLCTRVNSDAIVVHAKRTFWAGVTLGTGAAGLLLCLFVPVFWIGLPLFIVASMTAFAVYVRHRNRIVDEEFKIFTGEWIKEKLSGKKTVLDVETKVRLYEHDGSPVIISDEEAEDRELVKSYNIAQQILFDILRKRASIAEVRPITSEKAQVTFLVDGVPEKQEPIPLFDFDMALRYLKEKGGMDSEESSREQNGQITVDIAQSPQDMKLISGGMKKGEMLRIQVIQEMFKTNFDLLGMREEVRNALHDLFQEPGLTIVSGPPRSGVTSTAYSLLRKQDAFIRLIYSVEHKPGIDLPNITQEEYESREELPKLLASTIRRDPDVLYVDNCPSAEVAGQILDFAAEKTVLLSLRASNAIEALAKWAQLVGDVQRAVGPLKVITCQTLARCLCPTCKTPCRPDPKVLKKLNIKPGKVEQFYRTPIKPKAVKKSEEEPPCETCNDKGYFGMTGIFEYMPIVDELRKTITGNANIQQIQAVARKLGVLSLDQEGLYKVVTGDTDVKEIVRVFQHPENKKENT